MLNLKIHGFPKMDEDKLVATHTSNAQSRSQIPSASQSQIPPASQSQSQSQTKSLTKSQRKSQTEEISEGKCQPLQRLTSTITFLGKMLLNVLVPMPVGKEHTTTRNNLKHAMKRFSYHVFESNLAAEKMCDVH